MLPVLGEVAGLTSLRTYGIFAALGIVLGIVVTYRYGVKAGADRRDLFDLILWVLIGALLGAKLVAILSEGLGGHERSWDVIDVFGHPWSVPTALIPWRGGLVYHGGIIFGALTAAIFARRRGLDVGLTADILVPGVALGHVWGRLGCFLAGCCFGKAGGGALRVSFSDGSHAYLAHAERMLLPEPYEQTYALHPVQMYEAAAELALAALVIFFLVPRRRLAGRTTLIFLSAFSALRFFIEIYRGDTSRGFLGDPLVLVELNRALGVDGGSPTMLSVPQLLAVMTLLACGWMWFVLVYGGRGRSVDHQVLRLGRKKAWHRKK